MSESSCDLDDNEDSVVFDTFPSCADQREIPPHKSPPRVVKIKVDPVIQQRKQLREKLPYLTKEQIDRYQRPYHETVCHELENEGYPDSKAELTSLLECQQSERDSPGSLSHSFPTLHEQHYKLDSLRDGLKKAEDAKIKDDKVTVCNGRRDLAKLFEREGDQWLVEHFYYSSLEVAKSIRCDGGKQQAYCHCDVGRMLQKKGCLQEAQEHFELMHSLAVGKPWKTEDDELFSHQAALLLHKILLERGKLLEEKDPQVALHLCSSSLRLARQVKDFAAEGASLQQLGSVHEELKDSQTALIFLEEYLRICEAQEDHENICVAYIKIANSYKSLKDIDSSLQYLQRSLSLAKEHNISELLGTSYGCIGHLYNDRGQYQEALLHFEEAYRIFRESGKREVAEQARFMCGIARANNMWGRYIELIAKDDKESLLKLLEWKSSRKEF